MTSPVIESARRRFSIVVLCIWIAFPERKILPILFRIDLILATFDAS
jgi:hypothetical protein